MARPKKNQTTTAKLPKQQADGKDRDKEGVMLEKVSRTLDDVWGRKFSPYGTTSLEEYKARIDGLTKFDLQQECIKVGLYPQDDRQVMIDRLTKQCSAHLAAARTAHLKPRAVKVTKAAREVLHRLRSLL